MMVPVDTGASVRDLQDAVRDAVERGDFRAAGRRRRHRQPANRASKSLLADLTNLKSAPRRSAAAWLELRERQPNRSLQCGKTGGR